MYTKSHDHTELHGFCYWSKVYYMSKSEKMNMKVLDSTCYIEFMLNCVNPQCSYVYLLETVHSFEYFLTMLIV